MLKKRISVCILAIVMLSASGLIFAQQAIKIGIIDYQRSLLESDAAKKYAEDSEKKYGADVVKIQKMEEDLVNLNNKLQQEEKKLKPQDKINKQNDISRKTQELREAVNKLNESKNIDDSKMLQKLRPQLDRAITEIVQDLNYDIVIDKSAVPFVKLQYDITEQVVSRMNKINSNTN